MFEYLLAQYEVKFFLEVRVIRTRPIFAQIKQLRIIIEIEQNYLRVGRQSLQFRLGQGPGDDSYFSLCGRKFSPKFLKINYTHDPCGIHLGEQPEPVARLLGQNEIGNHFYRPATSEETGAPVTKEPPNAPKWDDESRSSKFF